MKQILVLGAGQSSPYLIHHLLQLAERHGWSVTVGDLDPRLALRRVAGHPLGDAIEFDVQDAELRASLIRRADVVVNMLSPRFQDLVALDCMHYGRHMVSVSYRSSSMRAMDASARRRGALLLCEMGLDPGIDHMSAMALIRRIGRRGGRITGFRSYGSGIPVPDQEQNPLKYMITWNPRNVVMSGEHGAQYLESGRIKIVPFHEVFHHTWAVDVEGVGTLEAYPNRDALSYMRSFGLKQVHTMIRGTLRYPGFCETWAQIVRLGLPNESLRIPNLKQRTYREVVEMFLPLNVTGPRIEQRIGRFLNISPTGRIMEDLRRLGLLSDKRVTTEGETAAAMMIDLLNRKLPLSPGMRDMVVVVHDLDVDYPGADRPAERITSTLVAKGEANGFTAMAKSVGLPAAAAVELMLENDLPLTGCHIPTHASLYRPILRVLEEHGLKFTERTRPVTEEPVS